MLYADVGTWACGSPTQRWNLATFRSLLALLFAVVLCSAVDAATITVTSIGDTTAVDGSVTLREAITSINNGANVNADVVAVGAYGTNDAIHFNIPGAGVQSIVLSATPAVTKPVIIDGYTQPLAAANTNGPGQGTNALLLVELRFNSGNLTIAGGNSTVQGLVINGVTGVLVLTGLGGNTVAGNFIGTDATGNAAGPHGAFALIDIFVNTTSPNNTIGGVTPAARNLISGTSTGASVNPGILIESSGNTVEGNLIGTNAAGNAALPNDIGINIFFGGANNNVIGGTTAGARNIISGNRLSGIEMDTSGHTVQGNYIGTDVTGTAAIANGSFGITIGGTGNTIGGTIAGAGNVVSGNGSMGITFAVGATGNTVQGNRVGTDPTGAVAVGGQTVSGIEVDASNNTIGGTVAGAANIVAFNAGAGVRVSAGTGSGINGNSIFSNTGLGIALGQAGVPNVNDPGDPDLGANNFQNYPVLTSASSGVGTVTVSGTLNSSVTTAFRLEFFANVACDASTHGEGQSFIGFANVATDGGGNASFGPLVFGAPAGQTVVTATATDPANNTSEFSQCLGGGALPTLSINNVSNNEGNSGTTPFTFTVTLSASSASTVTVNYATANGTATAGSDYVATSGVLTFAPGITTQPITVLVNGDMVVEPDETFTVTLSTPTNATIATAQGTGTILNDDVAGSPGTLQFSAPAYSVGEGGGSAVITVTRVGGSSGAVSVTAATVGGGTATAGADYTVTSVSLNWPDGDASSKTLVVPIIDDALVEPSETINLALSVPTGGAALGAQATAILTIIDNDALPPPISQPIPTLSWTGLLLLAGLLVLAAIVRTRRLPASRSQMPPGR
jgi:hypothetical protein